MQVRYLAIGFLSLALGAKAMTALGQSDYRPSTSKNKSHAYFRNGTVYFVNSSHQDLAWMDSIGACEKFRDEMMITPALEIMKRNPEYCFSVEDAMSLREYLKRHPERYDDILKYTKQGRLEWGAMYNMPYESMYDGESLVRQLYLGRKWLKKMLPGCDFQTAWNEDVPGTALQLPQILSKAGVKYLYISRQEPGIYKWYSPDGSDVLMYTPGQYDESASDIVRAKNDSARREAVIDHLDSWDHYFEKNKFNPALPILIDRDWALPDDYLPMVQAWNRNAKSQGLPRLTYSTSAGPIEKLISAHAAFEKISGERPNSWLYIHGPTHERALTASRKASRTLVAAEIFSAVDATLKGDFSGYPQSRFTTAWENAIYPDHGWGGRHGDMTDLTFREKFETAGAIADTILQSSLQSIASQISRKGKGRSIVVFNPLSRERTDKVEVSLAVYGQDTLAYKIVDDVTGQEVPSQLMTSTPAGHTDEVTTLAFVAENVPSLGYKTYSLVPYSGRLRRGVPVDPTNPSMVNRNAGNETYENKFYRIQFGQGGLKSIYDKELGAELLDTHQFLGGEVFQLESVGNGAGEFSDVQPVTMNGFEKVSQYQPNWNCTEFGPVRKSWTLEQQTRFATIRQTVTLYDNLKKIDFKVDILGFSGERYREYRMAFPLKQTEGKIAYEVPMGVVEVGKSEMAGAAGYSKRDQIYSTECSKVHPREVQDWFSSSKDSVCVTIASSVAVFDWVDPADSTDRSVMLQPILLASRKSCHWEGNYYLQPGNHSYAFSLTSSRGNWTSGADAGKEQNHPLLPVTLSTESARQGLPASMSFAGTDAGNVHISTIKKSDDENSIIIRVVDMQGKAANANIHWFGKVNGVTKTNLIEEGDQPLSIKGTGINITVDPYSIETIRVR